MIDEATLGPGAEATSAAAPVDETLPEGRMAALPREPLEDLARLAARICGTPWAVMSFPRGEEVRFAAPPHAPFPERIRFYAGAPLVLPDGELIGSLVVLDTAPRELSEEQRQSLLTIARQAVAQMEVQRLSSELARGIAFEREQAARAVRHARESLRSVFMNAPSCVCVLRGPDHVFELANPPYRELVGHRELEGLPARAALPELAEQGYFELLDRVYRTGEPFVGSEMPARLRRGDRVEEVFFNFVYQPMPGADGKPEGIVAFGFDVTAQVLARRRAEELVAERDRLIGELQAALRAREQSEERLRGDVAEREHAERELALERLKLRRLLEAAPFAAVVYEGPEHIARFSNPKHDELTGGRVAIGRPLLESLPELAGQPAARILDEVYRTGETRTTPECHFPLMRGGRLEDRWFHTTWQPIWDGSGKITAVLVSAVEVTGHVLARKKLQEAHRLTEAITSNATLGLFMMDDRQHCTFMNPAAEKITGFRLDELQGKPLHYFVHHSHPDGTPYPIEDCPIDRALPTKSQERGEDVFVHKDGHFYPVAFTASPILEGGRPVGTVIEVRDTSEEKAAQQERERILADLRAAVAARDEFLSIASHELKTPLTPLQLQLDNVRRSLARAGVDDPRTAARLDQATRQTHRLARLVDNLLDVSRITAGRLALQVEELDLAALAAEVIQRSAGEASSVGSRITLHAEAPVRGRWDRLRIEQVVSNLLSNAIKYGSGRPVEVQVEPGADAATLTVRDHGIGIAPEDVTRIFDRFERAVSARHFGGMGLGLYIARQIVEAHGGSISVRSAPGEGSTFTVVLPRVPLSPSRRPEHPPVEARP